MNDDNPYASPREQGSVAKVQYRRRIQMVCGFVALIGFGYIAGIITTLVYPMPAPSTLPAGSYALQACNAAIVTSSVVFAIRGLYIFASESDRKEPPHHEQ